MWIGCGSSSLKAKAEEGRRDDDLRLGALRIVFEGVRTWEGSQAVEGVYRSVQQASIPAPAFGTSPPADWGDSYVNRQSLGGEIPTLFKGFQGVEEHSRELWEASAQHADPRPRTSACPPAADECCRYILGLGVGGPAQPLGPCPRVAQGDTSFPRRGTLICPAA